MAMTRSLMRRPVSPDMDDNLRTASATTNDCVVKQFVTAKQLDGLEPRDVGTEFTTADNRVIALVRLDCTTIDEKEIVTFRWSADGKEMARSKAGIAISRNWRIWSQARIKPGAWLVELIDASGQVLVAEKFVVREP